MTLFHLIIKCHLLVYIILFNPKSFHYALFTEFVVSYYRDDNDQYTKNRKTYYKRHKCKMPFEHCDAVYKGFYQCTVE